MDDDRGIASELSGIVADRVQQLPTVEVGEAGTQDCPSGRARQRCSRAAMRASTEGEVAAPSGFERHLHDFALESAMHVSKGRIRSDDSLDETGYGGWVSHQAGSRVVVLESTAETRRNPSGGRLHAADDEDARHARRAHRA